ncbi:MAG: TonB-dependent receptor [Cytophagales bacterium]|nr:TonB-dependent receptor [Cytophagales bacterium]
MFVSKQAFYLFLIQTIAMQLLLAKSSNGQKQLLKEVSLGISLTDVSLQKVFHVISEETGFVFGYDTEFIKSDRKKYSLHFKKTNLRKVLEALAYDAEIRFKRVNNNILVVTDKRNRSRKKIMVTEYGKISGRVTDENGHGLPGVNVMVKGTDIGTITDVDGHYELDVPSEATTLVFSYVGYISEEIEITGRSEVDIALTPDIASLSEVVVIGYGSKDKRNLTGAVSTVDAKTLNVITTGDISNALTGKLPGLRVMQVGGEPGLYDNQIDIRGWGNMLVVVDGIPREDFQKIDPGAIASISILKDASAAVFGVKAANGVMLITTKKGQEGPAKVTLDTSVGFEELLNYPKPIDNAIDALILKNEGALARGRPMPYPGWERYTGEDPDFPSVNWWDLTIRERVPIYKNNLSVSGGSNKVTYFMSLGTLHQEGIYKSGSMDYNRYNLRTNISANLKEGLTANLIFTTILEERNRPYGNSSWDFFKQVWMQPPWEPIYLNNTEPLYYDGQADRNPLAITDSELTGYRKYNTRRYETTLSLVYDIPSIQGLQLKGLFAYDMKYAREKQFRRAYKEYRSFDESTNQYGVKGLHDPTRLRQYFDEWIYYQTQLSIRYNRSFLNNKHNIDALLLTDLRNGEGTGFRSERFYQLDVLDQLDAGLITNQGAGGSDKILDGNKALVGRLNYDFDTKYLVEFSFRYDGSSRFPKDSRWGFFPAMSLGWRLSDENFIRDNIGFMDNLKLRFSHGKMGDDRDASNFQYLTGYSNSGAYIFDGTNLVTGIASRGLNNPHITWYTATTTNLGLDGSLWKRKLDFQFDFFQRKRSGLLARRSATLPASFGANLPQENLNSDLSKGFEIVLGHSHEVNGINYSVRGNITYARLKWVHREQTEAGNSYIAWRHGAKDRWTNIRWGYGYEGQFQTEEEINSYPIIQDGHGHSEMFPGDFKYEDWNGDGMINSLDQHPIGRNEDAEIFYGMDISATWKGLSLNLFFQGATNYSLKPTEQLNAPLPWGRNSSAMFLDRWRHEDPLDFSTPWVPGKYPISRDAFGYEPKKADSEFWMHNVRYLRLKSIELSYQLPDKWISTIKAQEVRLYGNAFNVFTWANKDLLEVSDPEHRMNQSGADNGYKYPIMANYNLGLSITF